MLLFKFQIYDLYSAGNYYFRLLLRSGQIGKYESEICVCFYHRVIIAIIVILFCIVKHSLHSSICSYLVFCIYL
jgi:hypothetical protein